MGDRHLVLRINKKLDDGKYTKRREDYMRPEQARLTPNIEFEPSEVRP
jgi:hypothetical protein